MRLGMSLYADNIGEKINTFEFADYIETNIPDGPMTELEPHRDRIKVIHLPDLNNRCHEKLVRAFELGIEKAVVHYFTFKEAAPEWKIAELRILTTFAEKNGIKLCLENT